MRDAIEWAEPPAEDRGRNNGVAELFAEALKARPGEWAVYRRGLKRSRASASASHLRRRWGLEVVTRGPENNVAVYARYVNGNGK